MHRLYLVIGAINIDRRVAETEPHSQTLGQADPAQPVTVTQCRHHCSPQT